LSLHFFLLFDIYFSQTFCRADDCFATSRTTKINERDARKLGEEERQRGPSKNENENGNKINKFRGEQLETECRPRRIGTSG
jgi:hypothetical protein